MKEKPLIFKILLILFLIEPIIKIFYFKALTEFDYYVILSNLLSRTGLRDIFDFWLVFPIAGIALIKLRKWSYFIFISMMIYTIFSLMTYEKYTWPYNSETPFSYHYFIVGISIVSLILFLFPSIREPFFNKRLRWWETKTRFKTNIPCKIISSKGTFETKILNLSQSGAFLKDAYNFRSGEEAYKYLGVAGTLYHSSDVDSYNGVKFAPDVEGKLNPLFSVYTIYF